MFGFGFPGRAGVFEAKYRVYPVSFIDKNDAENGNKIFLPPSALDRLGKPKMTVVKIISPVPSSISVLSIGSKMCQRLL